MLSQFTDEQLREELKRRAKEKRVLQGRKETEYIYLKGVVVKIDNLACTWGGKVKHKPYSLWEYRLTGLECDEPRVVNWCFHEPKFKCALRKAESPKIGDKVVVKIFKPKVLMPSNVRTGRIVEVVKE